MRSVANSAQCPLGKECNMELKELRAFCSVAASGGFSRAAAALGVA